MQEKPVAHPELHLTPRQSEVLQLLEEGRSTTQIAEELHLSRETVRNHIRALLPLPVWGVIVGRSLYEKKVDLGEALKVAREN